MELQTWLRFAHIVGAIVWVGGGVMLSLVGLRARRSGNMVIIGEFARMLSYVGLGVLAPAVVVVLVSGVWLVLAESREFTELWVLLALAAFAAAFVLGAVFLSRNAIALERVATGSDIDPHAANGVLGRWIGGYVGVLAILVFAVWDMIFKPGT
jgi:uncharacterized membrane protein